MNAPKADPARTQALLVGVEKYQSSWDLDGPARDVIEFREWLLANGVPAAQITTLVSPLESNRAALAGIGAAPAASTDVRYALNALHEKAGDLLVLFWAGHGFIHDKGHCLLVADASRDDKRNYCLDELVRSLASSQFPGFPRQIIIVDACANRERFAIVPGSEPVHTGAPLPHEQFVFFAARPGQVAQNLGEEKRGLFSREFLKQARALPAAGWPPDMRALAERVQAEFAALRATSRLDQTPLFHWTRDWSGNVIKLKDTPEAEAGHPTKAPSWKLSLTQNAALTDALCVCDSMALAASRDDVLAQIRFSISIAVPRRTDTRSDVTNIVRTAARYSGGLEELLKVVRYYEGNGETSAWKAVEQVVKQHLPGLEHGLVENSAAA